MPSPSPTPAADPAGLPARRTALIALDRVLRRGQTLEAAMAAASGGGLAAADRALAAAIAGETLRRLPDLDALIDSATRLALADDAKARMVLRLALAQKIALHVPDHALVATALPLVDGGPRRLVHGVLGTLLRRGVPAPDRARLPTAVADRWRAPWGDQAVAAAEQLILRRAPLDLSFADDAALADFRAATPNALSLAPHHARLSGGAAVADLAGFADGRWWVQDLSASLPARLIPRSAQRVLDLAAAPGGKTMQLAAAGHDVIAVDVSKSRLARLHDNLTRTRLRAELIEADLTQWRPAAPVDAILFDAPCSATGTFRRHPEVLYRAHPAIIAEMAQVQARLLARIADWLVPGGSLIFATCSLEPAEGEEHVARLLAARPDYRLAPADTGVDRLRQTEAAPLRITPDRMVDEGGADSFFIAHLVRA